METIPVNPEQSQAPANSYQWEVDGKKLRVHLDYAVIDRMLLEVMRGFGAIPRRGAEVGGILLGSIEVGDRITVRVEDFEPVVCEHKRGPSYLFSEVDLTRFEDTLKRHAFAPEKRLYAVGCYRSHTREGLGLSADDLKLFQSYFSDPNSVFLLIKPYATRASIAGFFFREEGEVARSESSYQEFPFRRRDLGGGPSPAQTQEPAKKPSPAFTAPRFLTSASVEKEKEKPAAAQSTELLEDDQRRARSRRNVWIPLSFIFLLVGVLVGLQVAFVWRPIVSPQPVRDAYTLALAASRSGENLHIRWDRTALPVRSAQRGVLTIVDGTYNTTVDLDVAQLNNPNVFYRNVSGSVKLKLEVFTRDRTCVSETLEWRR
jgi:hypothetical protein